MVKVMTRLIFIRKVSNMIGTRINAGNDSRDSSTRIMKLTKMVIKIGKSSEPSTRTTRDIRSNMIM